MKLRLGPSSTVALRALVSLFVLQESLGLPGEKGIPLLT